ASPSRAPPRRARGRPVPTPRAERRRAPRARDRVAAPAASASLPDRQPLPAFLGLPAPQAQSSLSERTVLLRAPRLRPPKQTSPRTEGDGKWHARPLRQRDRRTAVSW